MNIKHVCILTKIQRKLHALSTLTLLTPNAHPNSPQPLFYVAGNQGLHGRLWWPKKYLNHRLMLFIFGSLTLDEWSSMVCLCPFISFPQTRVFMLKLIANQISSIVLLPWRESCQKAWKVTLQFFTVSAGSPAKTVSVFTPFDWIVRGWVCFPELANCLCNEMHKNRNIVFFYVIFISYTTSLYTFTIFGNYYWCF